MIIFIKFREFSDRPVGRGRSTSKSHGESETRQSQKMEAWVVICAAPAQ